jgi:flagellar biosynthetic protein FlhB
MADTDKHSKTERPTGRRLQEARDKGDVPHSQDLAATVGLAVGFIALYTTGNFMFGALKSCSRDILGNMAANEVTPAGIYAMMLKMFLTMGMALAPFMLIVIIVGIATSIAQTGGINLTWEPLSLNLDRLNPVNGMSRFFNKEALFQITKSFIKILIVGYMAYKILRDEVEGILFLADTDIQGIIDFVGHISFKLVLHTCGVLLILAILDLAFVKWQFIEKLKMTKQEVKDEHKNMEGDPQIKNRIRSMQMERARRRLRSIIPTADVVITNPTHYAIALKYDREKMAAPMVIAKGMDYLALKIKEMAREHKVMLVENRPLARELYAQVNEGEEIPESLYAAVAEVLAYVYSIKGKV